MTNIISKFIATRKARKQRLKHLNNQWNEILEEREPIDTEYIKIIQQQFTPTPENIDSISKEANIDKDSAISYLLLNTQINICGQWINSGLNNWKGTQEQAIERVKAMPDFFMEISNISQAIITGRIKAKPKKVLNKLPELFINMVHTNEAVFWHTVNEMKNIANGQCSF